MFFTFAQILVYGIQIWEILFKLKFYESEKAFRVEISSMRAIVAAEETVEDELAPGCVWKLARGQSKLACAIWPLPESATLWSRFTPARERDEMPRTHMAPYICRRYS